MRGNPTSRSEVVKLEVRFLSLSTKFLFFFEDKKNGFSSSLSVLFLVMEEKGPHQIHLRSIYPPPCDWFSACYS